MTKHLNQSLNHVRGKTDTSETRTRTENPGFDDSSRPPRRSIKFPNEGKQTKLPDPRGGSGFVVCITAEGTSSWKKQE